MPSAQNSTVMLQLEGRTAQAQRCDPRTVHAVVFLTRSHRVARLLLCVYLLSTPAIGILMGRALAYSQLLG
jgi:hypothetical protein